MARLWIILPLWRNTRNLTGSDLSKCERQRSPPPLRLGSGTRSCNTSDISLKRAYLGAIVDDENPPRRRNRSWLRSLVTSLSRMRISTLLAPSYDLILHSHAAMLSLCSPGNLVRNCRLHNTSATTAAGATRSRNRRWQAALYKKRLYYRRILLSRRGSIRILLTFQQFFPIGSLKLNILARTFINIFINISWIFI